MYCQLCGTYSGLKPLHPACEKAWHDWQDWRLREEEEDWRVSILSSYHQSATALKGSESGEKGTNGEANQSDGQLQPPVAKREEEGDDSRREGQKAEE